MRGFVLYFRIPGNLVPASGTFRSISKMVGFLEFDPGDLCRWRDDLYLCRISQLAGASHAFRDVDRESNPNGPRVGRFIDPSRRAFQSTAERIAKFQDALDRPSALA